MCWGDDRTTRGLNYLKSYRRYQNECGKYVAEANLNFEASLKTSVGVVLWPLQSSEPDIFEGIASLKASIFHHNSTL